MASSSSTKVLSGWSPLTTRLLQEGGSAAWNAIDGILLPDGSDRLDSELEAADLWNKLVPARTQGDAQRDELLELLLNGKDNDHSNAVYNVRGDSSLFLSREYRSRMDFSERHPSLHRLISSVTATVTTKLAHCIDFDVSLTSVQLARYPGDGISGYARHCDRKGACGHRREQQDQAESSPPERIVTAIYYLTNDDWNASDDGGCLRLFLNNNNPTNNNQFVDIPPYRDRLLVFRSDGVEHQVLPSLRRPRTAITLWFYGTMLKKEPSNKAATTCTPNLSHPEPKNHPNDVPSSDNKDTFDHLEQAASTGPPPLPLPRETMSLTNTKRPRIFVSIASYRDSETGPTLHSLFSTAKYPDRVSVGLVLQLEESSSDDSRIWNDVVSFRQHSQQQIRCLRMDARDALGPCYARALCQSLLRGEDFVLQIDSHMRFRDHWDEYLIQLLHDTIELSSSRNEKVVLTAYPVGYTLPNQIPNETRGTLLVPWKFDNTTTATTTNGMLRQRGRLLLDHQHQHQQTPRETANAIPCHLYAGGFNFAPARVLEEVPYDPTLHQLFFGEELSMAVRLFTHGYDVYAPPETVCYHLWSRSHRPTQTPAEDPHKLEMRRLSLAVVHQQLRGRGQPCSSSTLRGGYYGLGTARTAAQFAERLGVDFDQERMTRDDFENGCLEPSDFADSRSTASSTTTTLYSEDSVEAKVASLDTKAQQLIAFFLSGVAPTNNARNES